MSAEEEQEPTPGSTAAAELEDGRYVYCVVPVPDDTTSDSSTSTDGLELDVDGVDGGTPFVVATGGVGAVVQPCTSPFESDDVRQLGRWLFQHQAVVDAAGRRFGTPLPFRFDTVVEGGDAAVRDWLDDDGESFRSALASLDGQWEYRIEVTFDYESLEASVADDPSLAELDARREEAAEGTAYLLEKKYEKRKSSLVADEVSRHRERLSERLAELCEAVRPVERAAGVGSLTEGLDEGGGDGTDQAGGEADSSPDGDADDAANVSLSVLAKESNETAVGDVLEELADETGASVKFTGPWPPYTYAPELLDDGNGEGTASDDATRR